jgi:hypothetical protein
MIPSLITTLLQIMIFGEKNISADIIKNRKYFENLTNYSP